jgi:hypothetical protein
MEYWSSDREDYDVSDISEGLSRSFEATRGDGAGAGAPGDIAG